jgi:hypothetical protein
MRHVNTSDGIGVCFLTWNSAKNDGKCPSLAPVANNLADVKIIPFTPPNVLSATNIGINQANDPNILLPNVCLKESVKFDIYIKQKKIFENLIKLLTTATAKLSFISSPGITTK